MYSIHMCIKTYRLFLGYIYTVYNAYIYICTYSFTLHHLKSYDVYNVILFQTNIMYD